VGAFLIATSDWKLIATSDWKLIATSDWKLIATSDWKLIAKEVCHVKPHTRHTPSNNLLSIQGKNQTFLDKEYIKK